MTESRTRVLTAEELNEMITTEFSSSDEVTNTIVGMLVFRADPEFCQWFLDSLIRDGMPSDAMEQAVKWGAALRQKYMEIPEE